MRDAKNESTFPISQETLRYDCAIFEVQSNPRDIIETFSNDNTIELIDSSDKENNDSTNTGRKPSSSTFNKSKNLDTVAEKSIVCSIDHSAKLLKNSSINILPSPLSLLMSIVVLFSAMTGLLMGYDLCIIAVVLHPVKEEFQLCTNHLSNGKSLLDSSIESDINPSFSLGNLTQFDPLLSPLSKSPGRQLWSRPCPYFLPQHEANERMSVSRQLDESKGFRTTSKKYQGCFLKELFVAMVSPGAALGSLSAGFIADSAGRRLTLALSDVFITIGSFMIGFGRVFYILLMGRFFLGLGIGTGFVIFSTYVSEISPEKRRGQLVACQEVAQCVGCLLAYLIAAIHGNNEWRWLLISAGAVAAIQISGIIILPESPRWLIQKNKVHKAETELRRLVGLPPKLTSKDNTHEFLDSSQHDQKQDDITFSEWVLLDNTEKEEYLKKKEEKTIDPSDSVSTFHDKSYKKKMARKHAKIKEFNCELLVAETIKKMTAEVREEQIIKKKRYKTKNKLNESNIALHFSKSSKEESHPIKPYFIDNPEIQLQEHNLFSTGIDDVETPRNETTSKNTVQQQHIQEDLTLSTINDLKTNSFTNTYDTYCSLWKDKCNLCFHYRWQLSIALGCAICQNLTGSTAVLYYSTDIFELANVSSPFIAGVGIGLAKVFGIVIVIIFVERIGRRTFLLLGSFGTLISHLLFAITFTIIYHTVNNEQYANITSKLCIIAMIFYMFSQNISWAGLMFVVASEVLPSSVRGLGMGLTITFFWILAFLTQSTWDTLMGVLTVPGLFLLYAFLNIIAIIYTYYCIPELSGHSLEQIREIFVDKKKMNKQFNGTHK